MTNSVDPDQTAPIGEVGSGSTLFPSILNSSGNFFRCIFLGALRVKYLEEYSGSVVEC